MTTFFRFFATRHLFAMLITIIVLLMGITTLFKLERDTYPEVDLGEIIITTTYPGASPEDVELKVTNKIEEELKQVVGLKRYESFSLEDVSIIDVVIDLDYEDQEEVKRDIRDAVDRVNDFPEEVDESPLITEIKTSIFPVIEVGLAGDVPYRELMKYARIFEKKLKNIEGVSRVERYGWRAREINVDVDPALMEKYQLPLREIVAAIANRNIRSTAGSFESYTSEKSIVTLAQFRDPMEVGDVIVRSTFEGPQIKVKDLAIVKDAFEEIDVLSRMQGQPAISFIAYKSSSADIIRTVNRIKELIEEQKQYLPREISILSANDTSRYVRDSFNTVYTNGLAGLLLVLILLATFLNFRTAFWVAMGIPFSVLGAITMLPVFGVFLDSITLTGLILVVGIIVDDAIIVAENIYKHYESGESALDAAVLGIQEVFVPVLTTILTTFLAFAPMFFMPGIMGRFCWVIPLVMTLALLFSLVEFTIALPAHIMPGLKRREKASKKDFVFLHLKEKYLKAAHYLLKFPTRYIVVACFVIVLGGSGFYAFRFMDFVLFPSNVADQFFIKMILKTGTSLEATTDKVKEVEKLVTQLPKEELASYVSRIGVLNPELAESAENENYASMIVGLTPFGERSRTADEIVEALRQKTVALEGFEEVFYYIDAGGPPVGRPITIRVVGSDDKLRAKLATHIEERVQKIPGVKDIDRDDKEGKEQIEIKLDYERIARSRLTVADIAQTVRIAYDGEIVTSVRYGEDDVDFRVQLKKEAKKDIDYLGKLLVPNFDGNTIPLKKVAKLEIVPGPSTYTHYDGERCTTITGDVDKNITTPMKATQEAITGINLDRDYPGLQIVVGGEAEETQKSVNDLIMTLGIAALGIYFLLILLFNSVLQPILVMLAIPFGIIGVIIAFALHGEPLGFLAMMGIIGLAGVVVNDSLVLVSHVNRLREEKPKTSALEIVAQGASDRLRAILMTTFTTVVGLLPLAYSWGGSDPYMSSMALALSYGLLFATPLTLLLVPCFYLIGEDFTNLFRKKNDET